VWIDRVVTELETGPDVLELHPRLTVLSSTDRKRRRAPFDRVSRALLGDRGSHLELRTENDDPVVALRPADGEAQLINPELEDPLTAEELARSGVVAQLNSAAPMVTLMKLLSVSTSALRQRAYDDEDLIKLAQTPLDQLWTVAQEIQANREAVSHTEMQGTDLHEAVRERESIEETFSDMLQKKETHARRNKLLYLGAGGALAVAALVAASFNPFFAVPFIVVGALLGVAGYITARNRSLEESHAELTDQFGGTGFGVQLGRLDELFNTNSIYRKQREARDNLDRSMEIWRRLAGAADPKVLVRERPRIEELAGHIRIINNEQAVEPGSDDHRVLLGFASLLAELTRRFPSERVPLLIEDVFADLHVDYHPALRELIQRATHRRQVVLETADTSVAQWVAAEAVAGQALLITDQPISVTALDSRGAEDLEEDGELDEAV